MTPERHGQLENSSPYEMLQELKSMFEKQAGAERFDLIQTFHACKQEEGKPVGPYVIKMKNYMAQLERLGYVLPQDLSYEKGLSKKAATPQVMAIQGGRIQKANKKSLNVKGKEHPTKDDACHHYKEVGHCKRNYPAYLAELIKKKKQVGTASSSATSLPLQMIIVVMVMFIYLNINMKSLKYSRCLRMKVENQLGKTIKALRSDRGGEYISQEFKDYLKACGIVQQLTPPYAPQHNGETATRILNMVPTKKVNKTPYELWYEKVPNLSYLKVWGCEALVKRDTPDKPQQRSVKYAEFLEKNLLSQEISGRAEELKKIQDKDTSPSKNTSEIPIEVEGFEPPQEEVVPVRSYKAAILDLESDKWVDAMNAEMQSMKDNQVWCLVDLPPNCKTVGIKWFFKKKTNMDGIVHTYKARLVAKGYTQTYRVDYEETFSPVADIRSIRILIAIKAKVCKLQRSIYGLKQASRSWNKRFDKEIKRFGFAQNLDEPCVYEKDSGSNVTFLILYVDDIIIMRNHIPSLQSVKSYLGKCFAMKDLGEATFILGIKIYKDRSKRLTGLSQSAYMDKILKRFRMDTSKCGYIPMQERLDLNKTQGASTPEEVKHMQNVPYASSVGSIMYAVRCTRPDVTFAQNLTSRFQHNPREPHWTAVKTILNYLRNTKDMFLVYGGNPEAEL
ncbi:retrotransposon protein, putative, ty1-copia subclass [Tanacetum coccineum]